MQARLRETVELGTKVFSAPRGSLTGGRLEFARGAARVTIRGASIPDLFRARFERPAPSVSLDGGSVTVRYRRFSPRSWLRPRPGGRVTLSDEVAWDLSIYRGVAHLDADLRGLRVGAVEVRNGASRVELRLPRPAGVVPVRVAQ